MEAPGVTWIYTFPAWLFFAMVVVVACLLSGAGLTIFQRLIPPREELSHNDVAGPIVGVLGTILAVAVAFLLVGNWQEYDAAASTLAQEASATADLYDLAAVLPQPQQRALRNELQNYVALLVTAEWPAMRRGGHSPQAAAMLRSIVAQILRFEPKTNAAQNAQQVALALVNSMMDGRRARLFANEQGIPDYMWAMNFALAMLTIGACYLFRVRNRALHVAMILGLAVAISLVMAVTAELDYPFRGDLQLPPTPLVQFQHAVLTESD
jgi:hypothetical protein